MVHLLIHLEVQVALIIPNQSLRMASKGKKPKSKASGGQEKNKMSSAQNISDERFVQVLTDPRFKTLKKSGKKVKIDERFKGMFSEKRFTVKHTMDKRGRPIQHLSGEDMKQYYELSSDDSHDGQEDDDPKTTKSNRREPDTSQTNDSKNLDAAEEANFIKPKIPDARGLDSDSDVVSSSSDESSDEDSGDDDVEHAWGELDKDVERNDETSRRLAVCNVDWDRIKAIDLFVLFNSFKPENGIIKSVKVYKSEFGKKRLAEEEVNGPTELVQTPVVKDDEDNTGTKHAEGSDTSEYMTEKLRQYQLNRLKYYYAVVECDDEKTATLLYDELDSFEYESSASALDVRFVPEDVDFDDEEVHQECSTLPDFSSYKAPLFVTSALQQSKVELTWDETDPERKSKMDQAFSSKSEKALDDLEAYLASSADEDSDDSEAEAEPEPLNEEKKSKQITVSDKIQKYKDLLKSIDEEDENDEPEMEITFDEKKDEQEENASDPLISGSDDESDSSLVEDSEENDLSQNEKRKHFEGKEDKKRKDKKKRGKDIPVDHKPTDDGLDLLIMDDKNDGKSHFSYDDYLLDAKNKNNSKKGKKQKQKRKMTSDTNETEDNFKFDADDPRFSKIYSSHLYNIDPSDPHFKKTQAMETLIDKKVQKGYRHQNPEERDSGIHKTDSSLNEEPIKIKDVEISSLVESIRRNTQKFKSSHFNSHESSSAKKGKKF